MIENALKMRALPAWWEMINDLISHEFHILRYLHGVISEERHGTKIKLAEFRELFRAGPWTALRYLPLTHASHRHLILRMEMPEGVDGCKNYVPINTVEDVSCFLDHTRYCPNYTFIDEEEDVGVRDVLTPIASFAQAFKTGYVPPAARTRTIEVMFAYEDASNYYPLYAVWGNFRTPPSPPPSLDSYEKVREMYGKYCVSGFFLGPLFKEGFKEIKIRYE